MDKNLHPWYMKKRAEDYSKELTLENNSKGNLVFDRKFTNDDDNFYRIIKQEVNENSQIKEEELTFLKMKKEKKEKKEKKHKKDKKHRKHKKYSKHSFSSNEDETKPNIELLRKQRLDRELKSKKRIDILLQKNK